MTNEQTRADFDEFLTDDDETPRDVPGEYQFTERELCEYTKQAMWESWQSATLKERERCKNICTAVQVAFEEIAKSAFNCSVEIANADMPPTGTGWNV